jgi:2'-hydroxyisoflavone reductase
MKILVIGGTQFIGRHLVEILIRNGDQVTLFHRGRTNPELFPETEHRFGDRGLDMSALASGAWEATIDLSAYVPRHVYRLAEALGGRGGRYVHISSVSAYADPPGPGLTEDAPLRVLDDPTTETVDGDTYGGLKALCERASHGSFGAMTVEGSGASPRGVPVSIVRPTYVAGPHDHTRRFTWWVERVARGGRVLAPGPKDNPFQVIDVRDLAEFLAQLAYGEAKGTFHAVSPAPPFSFEDFLSAVVDEVGPAGTELVWVEARALIEAGATDAELPLWAALGPHRYLSAADPSRAIAAGLRPRPLGETIRDVYQQEVVAPTVTRPRVHVVGISPARERELLELSA